MSIFEKKFQELLQDSEEHKQLKQRVASLETQVASLQKSLLEALQAYNNVARMTIEHRKSLEEIFAFLTDPLHSEATEEHDEEHSEQNPEMTPEELEAYKRNLN